MKHVELTSKGLRTINKLFLTCISFILFQSIYITYRYHIHRQLSTTHQMLMNNSLAKVKRTYSHSRPLRRFELNLVSPKYDLVSSEMIYFTAIILNKINCMFCVGRCIQKPLSLNRYMDTDTEP